jgi:hypothetical protein
MNPLSGCALEGISTPRASSLLTRSIILALAAMAGCWSLFAYSILIPSAQIEDLGARIAVGESFKRESIMHLQPRIGALEKRRWLPAESRRGIAMIELRLAELDMLDGKAISRDPQFARARRAIVDSLRASPSDGFMWFALFWLLKTRDGFSQSLIPLLRMSYLMAPHEGWIEVRRNRAVMPLLPSLPADLVGRVVAEFRSLVETPPYLDAAADILTGPGWPYHDILIRGLANAPDDAKQQIDDAVYNLGFDAVIPGVAARGSRPWH